MTLGLEEIVLRDVLTGLTYTITIILAIFSWILYRKSSHKLSSTMGLSMYFITFALYIFIGDHGFLFEDLVAPIVLFNIGSYIWIGGMLFFIFTVERDLKKVGQNPKPITLIGIIYLVGMTAFMFIIPLFIGHYFDPGIIFIGFGILIMYIAYQYIGRVQDFEITRRSSPKKWFIIGVLISGVSNFLVSFGLFYSIFIVKNCIILIGSLLLAYAWSKIPDIEELDWMFAIDRLMVIHTDSSIPLAEFKFKAQLSSEISESDAEAPDQALVAGALGGISSLIGEILTISGDLNEISYGGKIILFDRRQRVTSILIAEKSSLEIRYRLDLFGINFEKEYRLKLEQFSGDIEPFEDIDDLVTRIFG